MDDPLLGRPLCFECFDYSGAVLWNAHAARLWNNTIQATRRSVAQVGGVTVRALNEVAQIHYVKVAEIQRRGLIHFHVVLRADGPDDSSSDLPEWLTLRVLATTLRDVVMRVEATRLDGQIIRWGEVFDIQTLESGSENAGKVASYIAGYSTKTTNGSLEMGRQFLSRRQIRTLVDDPHLRQMALTSWDLSQHDAFSRLNLREHANTFGYTGHLLTKSRHYSTTFGALRAIRADFRATDSVVRVLDGTSEYVGRGYDDPRATQLAELIANAQAELRRQAAARRRAESHGDANGGE